MIRNIRIKGIEFAPGIPKICIPVSGSSLEEVVWEIGEAKKIPCDLIEWRIDHFVEDVESVLRNVITAAEDKPLLVTLRTKSEGGKADISHEEYEARISKLIRTRLADIVDIELSHGEKTVAALVALAKENDVKTVISAHNFEGTWSYEEICAKLSDMEAAGADFPKVACMPGDFGDVLVLMRASYETAKNNYPIITMSMGRDGKVSRLAGEFTGSAVTFGASKIASAPGQIKAALLKDILDELHR